MDRESRLTKNILIYFIGMFSTKGLQFLLLLLYTNYLTKQDYGYIDLLISSAILIVPVFSLQIVESAFRFMLSATTHYEQCTIISNSILVFLLGMLFFSCISIPIVFVTEMKYGFLFLIYIFVFFFFQLIQQLCRGMKRNLDFALSGIVFSIFQIVLCSIFIIGLSMQSSALLIGPLIAAIIGILFIEWRVGILKEFKIDLINLRETRELLYYSVPLIPNALGWWFIVTFGNIFITYYLNGDTSAAGLLGVANKFPALITMLNSIFFMAWQESAVEESDSEDRDSYYSTMFNGFVKFQISIVLIILPLIRLFIYFGISDEFVSAWLFIPFYLIGAVFHAYTYFLGTAYTVSKKTIGATKTTIGAAVISVILNVSLVHWIGIWTVPISVALTFIFYWILRRWDTKQYFNLDINYKVMASMLMLMLLVTLGYYLLPIMIQPVVIVSAIIIAMLLNLSIIKRLYSNFLRKSH